MTSFGSAEYGLFCCVCFEGLTPEKCAEDGEGRWNVCKGECAEDAGITEWDE